MMFWLLVPALFSYFFSILFCWFVNLEFIAIYIFSFSYSTVPIFLCHFTHAPKGNLSATYQRDTYLLVNQASSKSVHASRCEKVTNIHTTKRTSSHKLFLLQEVDQTTKPCMVIIISFCSKKKNINVIWAVAAVEKKAHDVEFLKIFGCNVCLDL